MFFFYNLKVKKYILWRKLILESSVPCIKDLDFNFVSINIPFIQDIQYLLTMLLPADAGVTTVTSVRPRCQCPGCDQGPESPV